MDASGGKRDASGTATHALYRIAEFERAILVMCSIGTLCLVLLTMGAGYAAWTVISARNAISASINEMQSHRTASAVEHRRK